MNSASFLMQNKKNPCCQLHKSVRTAVATSATDMKMFSRRGYSGSAMNTDDLVWNASLSRSFHKRKLTARLEGFDILSQQYNATHKAATSNGATPCRATPSSASCTSSASCRKSVNLHKRLPRFLTTAGVFN